MVVSKNSGTPKSSILIGFSHEINHPFWGTIIFGNTHMQDHQHQLFRRQGVTIFRVEPEASLLDPKSAFRCVA